MTEVTGDEMTPERTSKRLEILACLIVTNGEVALRVALHEQAARRREQTAVVVRWLGDRPDSALPDGIVGDQFAGGRARPRGIRIRIQDLFGRSRRNANDAVT